MIQLKLPAEMACDAEGCTATLDVRLVLLGAGTFGFVPMRGLKGGDWQVHFNRGNPMSPYGTRCPKHTSVIQKVIANAD